MQSVQIVGEVCKSSPYLTAGKVYKVLPRPLQSDWGDDQAVWIEDDDDAIILILTEHADRNCAHLGPNAKAVFV